MKQPSFQVLNFFHDDENSCAITILAHRTRFHIIADVNKLGGKSSSDTSSSPVLEEYLELLERSKSSGDEVRSQSHDGSTDSAIEIGTPTSQAKKNPKSPTGPDVDADTALYKWLVLPIESHVREASSSDSDTSRDGSSESEETLEDWYIRRQTRYFDLEARENDDNDSSLVLRATELEDAPDLDERMDKICCPALAPVPKYLRNIDDIPWLSAGEIVVRGCSSDPPPYYHPSIVEVRRTSTTKDDSSPSPADKKQEQFFFKPVDNADPQPTKREIHLLHQIARKGLHDKIRCPRLAGIVTKPNDTKETSNGGPIIMGFLQTMIADPTPVTEKFDADAVRQAQREQWAEEAAAMRDVLHENGLVWGDAKGDNLVVDRDGQLWIIDFGGSYTEGWVEPKLAETRDGDNMGVEKVVNALIDPVHNVAGEDDGGEDEEEEQQDEVDHEDIEEDHDASTEAEKPLVDANRKRKSTSVQEPTNSKRQKRRVSDSSEDASEELTYCYCNGPSSGTMIGCDGPECEEEWFHLECAGLDDVPPEGEDWFCRNCEPEKEQ